MRVALQNDGIVCDTYDVSGRVMQIIKALRESITLQTYDADGLFEGLQIVRNNPSNIINIREEVNRIIKSRQLNADFLSVSSHQIPTKGSNIDFLAGETGLEPATNGFGDRYSTN